MKIGLLPLYLKLYDDSNPRLREMFLPFLDDVGERFRALGVQVEPAPICRIADEFEEAVDQFERSDVDCIVTLHLAYSTSLDCCDALVRTDLPIVVLDTTVDASFNPDGNWIMRNHGIHGVQDMCNLLIRHGKSFVIEAGHLSESDLLDRVVRHVAGAAMARRMRTTRVGRVGKPFEGMGDFSVAPEVIERMGITIVESSPSQVAKFLPDDDDPEIDAEIAEDAGRFDLSRVDPKSHRTAVRTGIALRRWIDTHHLNAVSVNFLEITGDSGLPTMPFLEISKAMSRGIGYAGEGDILTASFVGTLIAVLGETSFTEMFCPDWRNETIFLGHMGEINLAVTAEKPVLLEKDWPYTDAQPPVFPSACLKPGDAVFADLAPGADGRFSLILAPVKLLEDQQKERLDQLVRGWMWPRQPIARFLERYSEIGGTHHAAIVYGDVITELHSFGKMMGWQVEIID